MTISEAWFSDEDLELCFEEGALLRGRRYWQDAAVLDLTLDTREGRCSLQAQVRGSESRPYRVQANWGRSRHGRLQLENECGCPLEGDCKHVVAALLAARATAEEPAPAPAPAQTAAPDSPKSRSETDAARERILRLAERYGLPLHLAGAVPAPVVSSRLPESLDHWLWRVATAAGDRPQNDSAGLLYELGHPANGGDSGLRLLHARRLKSGAYSGAKPYGHNSVRAALAQPPSFLSADDRPILRLLDSLPYDVQSDWQAERSAYAQTTTYRLRGSIGARLLGLLLATGRCFWRDHAASAPLREAAPREARWHWRTSADGSQRLLLEPEPLANVVATEPPWYVDVATGQAGELRCGLPDALAGALAEAPEVPAEHVAAVAERLASHTVAEKLPLPTAETVALHRDVMPEPILRLYGEEARPGFGAPRGARLAAAQAWFEYQGQRLRPQDPRLAITRRQDGAVWRIERQKAEEDRRLAELKRLSPLRGVPACFHPWETAQIEQRDFSIPRPREQESGWREFQEQHAAKLIARGWRIEYDAAFPFRYAAVEDWYGELREGGAEGQQQDWFGLELGVMVDGTRVNLLPILIELLRSDPQGLAFKGTQTAAETSLRLPDGRRLRLSTARLAPLVATLLELAGDRPLADGQLRLSRLDARRLLDIEAENPELRARWLGGEKLLELGRRMADFRGLVEVGPPAGLKAELRPYQREGLNWLQFLRSENLAGILADDMGLGKTVQTLAHLLLEKEQGRLGAPVLIVAPTSLMGNWRREAGKFTPGLRVLTLHGAERKGQHARIAEHDLVLTTYALLRVDHKLLAEQEYSWLVLDEAQHIKNAASATAKLARTLRAGRRLSLTGTPLENHLGELWSQFHFLLPGLLGSEKDFKRLYRNPIEKYGDGERRSRLQRRVAPFLLRRTKQQVATELPAKTEILRSVALDGVQRDLYETVRLAMDQKLRAEIARQGLDRSQIVMLDALLKLRQVCCDPRLVKLAAAKKAVVPSAKLDLLMELLPALLEEGRKVLLFSQFTSMLELIEERLRALGIAYAKLTGETLARDAEVARFQGGQVPLFLLSLKAGGVGLNLTAADTVIHYDPWWNPAAENQATDRAHRIGQDKPVFVYRLIVEGSVEERIQALQAKKAALFAGVVGDADGAVAPKFTADDLSELLRPLD